MSLPDIPLFVCEDVKQRALYRWSHYNVHRFLCSPEVYGNMLSKNLIDVNGAFLDQPGVSLAPDAEATEGKLIDA